MKRLIFNKKTRLKIPRAGFGVPRLHFNCRNTIFLLTFVFLPMYKRAQGGCTELMFTSKQLHIYDSRTMNFRPLISKQFDGLVVNDLQLCELFCQKCSLAIVWSTRRRNEFYTSLLVRLRFLFLLWLVRRSYQIFKQTTHTLPRESIPPKSILSNSFQIQVHNIMSIPLCQQTQRNPIK